MVTPGYQGHIPKLTTENVFIGKRVTELAREVFNDEGMETPKNEHLSATM
jgi:hypothetical protein